jgi:hypothetical protein
MDFSIIPLKGVGNVEFGMSPDEVRRRVGSSFRSFKRSPQAAFPCDYFDQLGMFCYYDSEGELEAVEMSSPAAPTINGIDLLKLDFETAARSLAGFGKQIKRENDGVIAYEAGVSIYAPLAKDNPTASVESVLAFRAGYYN